MGGRDLEVGEVAATSARDEDLHPDPLITLEDENFATSPSSLDGTHEPRGPGAHHNDINLHSRSRPEIRSLGKRKRLSSTPSERRTPQGDEWGISKISLVVGEASPFEMLNCPSRRFDHCLGSTGVPLHRWEISQVDIRRSLSNEAKF